MRARHLTLTWLVLSVGFTLACGSLNTDAPPDPPEEEDAGQTQEVWPIFQDEGADFIKAGSQQGLVQDAPLTLLGPTIGDTQHREILGSATVVKVWEDLAKLKRQRLKADATGDMVARPRLPEDEAELSGIPEVETAPPPTTRASTRKATTTSQEVQLPADLQNPDPDKRIDALSRYEPLPDATAYIVTVMKQDTNPDVRKKAWRVVRARWKRGIGSRSQHEQAVSWLASHGAQNLRLEAISALGNHSANMRAVSRYLTDDSEKVRSKSAHAVANLASRTGQQSQARKLLNDRLEKETDDGVRKAVLDALGDV